jgi:hypothetical protein
MSETPDIIEDRGVAATRESIVAQRPGTAETLARIATAVEGQRAEIYCRDDRSVRLAAWWAALGHEVAPTAPNLPLPADWFPWTLGNIQHAQHVFVRNAGPLPLRPNGPQRIRDLGMGSSLYLPVHDGLGTIGSVCVYWAEERTSWRSEEADRLAELARNCLLGG